jgi:hypothetical protein
MTTSNRYRTLGDELSHEYERLHTAKEDAFWTSMMGLGDDPDAARRERDGREIALQRFLQDPERLRRTREAVETAEAAAQDPAASEPPSEEDLVVLRGWHETLRAHAIESAEARTLAEDLVGREGRLERSRGSMRLGFVDPAQGFVRASSVELGVMIRTESDEARRRAAWEGLRSIEAHVLENGFLELVRERNRLGRMLGGEDYFDWKVRRLERMSKAEVFEMLGDLEERTRAPAQRFLEGFRQKHGAERARPWNLVHLACGESLREEDPHFPFSEALGRWGRSFAALGIDYNGAELVLDLVDRAGKYENGFMHGPVPAWREHGRYRPARIHFTANAIPGMVGSGMRASQTLFHEGGHAAHFANVDMPAPCFSQEFAPTSMALAETQSMFLDSLLEDSDWRARYARTVDGQAMPWELVERGIRSQQPIAAFQTRTLLAISFAERAIYEIPDAELSAERVLAAMRAAERELLFLEDGSPRPTLSVPHLLAGEASASYHGYVLAEMAVWQTREHFLARDGSLVDNPRIGPDLRDAYWRTGNQRGFPSLVAGLTGRPPSADALARHLGRTVEEAIVEARTQVEREKRVPHPAGGSEGDVRLNAKVRVVHGRETVAEGADGSFDRLARDFARWIEERAAARA